jgi:hypothetical protein
VDALVGTDQEAAAFRDVAQSVKRPSDAKSSGRLATPIREQRDRDIQRLAVSPVRIRAITGDRQRCHVKSREIVTPVTQKLQLGASGVGPVERIEGEEIRTVNGQGAEANAAEVGRNDLDIWDQISDLEHSSTLIASMNGVNAGATRTVVRPGANHSLAHQSTRS